MPARPLPNNPSLEHLKKQAKRLHHAVAAGDPEALAQVREFHPRASVALDRFTLASAQLVTARSYGFSSWATVKQHLADIQPFVWNPPALPHDASRADLFVRLACLDYAAWQPSNADAALRMLAEDPQLAGASIYAAAAAGDVGQVRAILERDPSLAAAKGGPLGWEPLLYACYSRLPDAADRSTLEAARLLLARGADPNAGFLYSGSYAFTALTGAFGRGEDWHNQPPHPECARLARLLLGAGADPNDAQTLYNRHFQADNEHLDILFAYGLGGDARGPWIARLNDPLFNPSTLLAIELCAAAQHNFFDRVRLLVERGVDVNARGLRNKRAPYEEAVRGEHHAIAEYLVEHGARRIPLDPLEAFALDCVGGRRDAVRARLAEDPGILERLGHHGRVDLLHRAVDRGQHDGVRLIVELGVDVNGMVPGTGLDRAPLHNAAGWGSLAMVKLLLELGADPSLRDATYHAAPIGWAFHNHQQDVVDHLMAFANIFDAVRCGGVERVALLLKDDASLATAKDEDGDALVFYVHPDRGRAREMVQLLLAHGASLEARDSRGRTLLDRAVAHGWTALADVLREFGPRHPL
jgi:ankyrin repeat protein